MNANVAEALRRLRAADPAAEAGDEPWAGSPAEEMARQRLHEPHIISIDAPDTASNNSRARRWPAIAAAAAVAALAIGIGATALSGSGPGPSPAHTPAPIGPAPGLSNRARAEALVDSLLAGVKVLPGAVRHHSAPAGAKFAGTTLASSHLLTRTAWWTAPGTMRHAIHYLSGHAPTHTYQNGTFSQHGSDTDVRGLDFGGPTTFYARNTGVQLAVVAYRGGVAIQAQAQTIWVPRRPAWTRITDPRAVAVTVQRGTGRPPVHRTLRGSDLHRLANVVNALPVDTNYGERFCPEEFVGTEQILRFTTATGIITAHVMTTGCTGVTMSAKGHLPFHLKEGALSRTVLNLLGLKPIRR